MPSLTEKVVKALLIVAGLLLFGLTAMLFQWAHDDDARLKAECEARGGVFVEARSPMHVCVKTLPLER